MNTLISRIFSPFFAKIRESKLFQLPHSEDRMHIAYRKKGIVENKKKNRDLLCVLLFFGPKQRKAKHKWYFKRLTPSRNFTSLTEAYLLHRT